MALNLTPFNNRCSSWIYFFVVLLLDNNTIDHELFFTSVFIGSATFLLLCYDFISITVCCYFSTETSCYDFVVVVKAGDWAVLGRVVCLGVLGFEVCCS